jgi:predicted DCC family thiol-disulfide oxidoreductase YuxK
MPSEPLQGWVLYDGNCGICKRLARFWEPTLQRLGLSIAPLQSPWVQERTGLDLDALLTDLRLLRPDGRIISGPNVYRSIMRQTPLTYPLYLLSIIPGLSQMFDWSYRVFARNRGRISSACGIDR